VLKLIFSRHVVAAEAERNREKVEAALTQLQPGFRLLTDLSALESMGLDCAPQIERTMDLCNARGVAKVVRVIPDPHKDIGLNIMSLFHYRAGVLIVTCESMDEAMKILGENSAAGSSAIPSAIEGQ